MKARVKATGEVIDVSPVIDPMGNSFYTENGISHYNPRWYAYYASDLDFDVEQSDSDLRISVAHLREVLDKCCEVGYINQYGRDRIIEIVKSEI